MTNPKNLLATTPLHVTYIGHATLLIEMDGVRLLTDPVLRSRVWHLRRRNTEIQEKWYQNLDAVLISHLHWDHLDLPSLKLLDETTHIIVPPGTGRMLRRRGFRHVEELSIEQSLALGSVTLTATYAHHNGARFKFGPTADSLGFIIQGSQTVYFAGDTDLFPKMATLTEKLDIALLPVWGWGPTLGPGHLDPYRAALALQLLAPALAIPIHWGTLHPLGFNWLNPSFLVDPPHTFAHHAAQLAPEVEVQILLPGNSILL